MPNTKYSLLGNQPPPRTGQAFLHRLHGSGWKDIWVATYDDMGGGRAGPTYLTSFPVSTGHYYSTAHIKSGAATRSNATFESLWAIVLDDVGVSGPTGAKVDLSEHRMLLPEPTAVIETSQNNFQWVYALASPEADADKVRRAFALLKLHPVLGEAFKDTGDLTHYFRLPGGVNPKKGKGNFSTVCTEFDAANVYEFDDLMALLGIDMASAPAAPARKAPTTYTQMPTATLRGMLARLPNDGRFDDRNEWTKVAHAIASCTLGEPDEGRRLWLEWCAKWPGRLDPVKGLVLSDPKENERVWDTLDDDHYATAESLILTLETRSALYKDRVVDPGEGFTEEVDVDRVEAAITEVRRPAGAPGKEIDDLIRQLYEARPTPALYHEPDPGSRRDMGPLVPQAPTPPFPVYPILVPGYVRGYAMLLSGASGLGKSAYSVALTNVVTHNTPQILGCGPINPKLLGDVVIISNEDVATEINRRVYASRIHHKLGTPLHDYYMTPAHLASKSPDGRIVLTCAPLLRRLIELRKKRDIALIVIDTLASVLDGLDENSTDMQGAMSQFQRIAWACWASVVVIHHPTKAAGSDDLLKRTLASARGSGSLGATVRSGATISSPTAQEQEEFGFTPAQMDSIVVHEGSKNSWGRKAPRTFFNRISIDVPLVDMDGVGMTGDAVVLEHYSPTPRSLATDLSTIRGAFGKASGPIRYDPGHTKASQARNSLEKLSGLSLKRLKELVPLLEADGKVRVFKKKVDGNYHFVIEIVDWDEEEEGSTIGVP